MTQRTVFFVPEGGEDRAMRRGFRLNIDIILEAVERVMEGQLTLNQLHALLLEVQEAYLVPTVNIYGQRIDR